MDRIIITGGNPLRGDVTVSGAKNAALPILASTILGGGDCVLSNVPRVRDVVTMGKLLGMLGATVKTEGDRIAVGAGLLRSTEAPYELVKTMRASVLVLGPLVARWAPDGAGGIGASLAAGRVCHWNQAGKFAPGRFGETRRGGQYRARVHQGQGKTPAWGTNLSGPANSHRDGKFDDGGLSG